MGHGHAGQPIVFLEGHTLGWKMRWAAGWGLPAKAIKTVEQGQMANWRRASSIHCLQTHHAAAARHGIPEAIHWLPNDALQLLWEGI